MQASTIRVTAIGLVFISQNDQVRSGLSVKVPMIYEVLSRSLGAAEGRWCAVGRGKRDKMAVPPVAFCKEWPGRAGELRESVLAACVQGWIPGSRGREGGGHGIRLDAVRLKKGFEGGAMTRPVGGWSHLHRNRCDVPLFGNKGGEFGHVSIDILADLHPAPVEQHHGTCGLVICRAKIGMDVIEVRVVGTIFRQAAAMAGFESDVEEG